jgi:adenosylhomocysteinase
MDMERLTCQHIIRALKSGLIPSRGLDRIAVGREEELKHLRADLESSQHGRAWVRCLCGSYSAGKTFFCSLVREEAWHRGFVVAAVVLGRDAPLHRFDVMYRRIMDAMRTVHFREVPAFEFLVQEWLLNLETEVQRSMGLNPLNAIHRGKMSTIIAQQIGEQLAKLRIYDRSFANAVRGYYEASKQGNDAVASAAIDWLKGEANIPAAVRQDFQIRGSMDQDNAFNFLQAMAALVVHIGYAGLLVILDEADSIRTIARPDSRDAAYENIRFLVDKTALGEFAHCGFMLAGTEDLYSDLLRSMAALPAQHDRLEPERAGDRTQAWQHSLLVLEGFDYVKLHEVARRVRRMHGIADGWNPLQRLPDDALERLIAQTAAHFGEKFVTVPRGFLKGLVDILDALHHSSPASAASILATGIDVERIEAVEQEETHLTELP